MLSMDSFSAFKSKKIMGLDAPVFYGGAFVFLLLSVAAVVFMMSKNGGMVGSLMSRMRGVEGMSKDSAASPKNVIVPRKSRPEESKKPNTQSVMNYDDDDDAPSKDKSDVADVFKGIKM